MGSLQLYLYTQKDILIYKIFPLLDGRDGAHLSITCTFMRKLIRDLAEDHLLSRRMKNHVIYLKSITDFPKIVGKFRKAVCDSKDHAQLFMYCLMIPGEDCTLLFNKMTNKYLFVNNFYSDHCRFENGYWNIMIDSFIEKGYKWKLIHYPSVTSGKYCVYEGTIDKIYMHRGSCIWLEIPKNDDDDSNKKQKI